MIAIFGYLFSSNGRFEDFAVFVLAVIVAKLVEIITRLDQVSEKERDERISGHNKMVLDNYHKEREERSKA